MLTPLPMTRPQFPAAHRAAGCLFGAALGDAYGAPTEFMSYDAILRAFPPNGPQFPLGYGEAPRQTGPLPPVIRVTDDTQMMLAVGEALAAALVANEPLRPNSLAARFSDAFVTWCYGRDNNRAPGNTCMTACEGLARRQPWIEATVHGSKGCGANMRVQPVGLLRPGEMSAEATALRAGMAQLQAAMTHGHPTALAAADITAYSIADQVAGHGPTGLVTRLRDYANSQRTVYRHEWLGELWKSSRARSAEEYITRGWDEVAATLVRLEHGVAAGDRAADPCKAVGAGWIAEEAFGTAWLCVLLFPDDPKAALQRAAATSGDSDSIACLAGAFAGAHHGFGAWPSEWIERIEYAERLATLAAVLK